MAEVIPFGQFQDLLLSAQLGREGTSDEQNLLPRRRLEEEGWTGDARQGNAGVPGSADLVLPSGKQGQALNPQIHSEDKKGHHVNWVVCPLTRKLFNF